MRVFVAAVLAVALAAGLAPTAGADVIYDFTGASEFSGSGAPSFVGTVKVTISDTGPGAIAIDVEVSGLAGGSLKSLYLNIDGLTQTTGGPVAAGGTMPVGTTVDLSLDAFKADGDGFFDLLFAFPGVGISADGTYSGGFIGTLFTSADFDALSAPGGGHGPFKAAIHVGDVGGGANSGWYAPGQGTPPIPEPGTFVLFGLAAAGAYVIRRRRKAS